MGYVLESLYLVKEGTKDVIEDGLGACITE